MMEKRKFQRLDAPVDVALEIVRVGMTPKGRPRLHVKSRNLSKGGICLETAGVTVDGINLVAGPPFARDYRLHFSMTLFPKEPPVAATGEVRWYDFSREGDRSVCLLGVQFLEMEKGGAEQLARFLKNHPKSSVGGGSSTFPGSSAGTR